jgi:hypothetical protein
MDILPVPYMTSSTALTRQERKALERQAGATAFGLLAIGQVEMIERAKVRALGGVADETIVQAKLIADEVMRCAARNSLAAQMAIELAETTTRELKERIACTNRRLG